MFACLLRRVAAIFRKVHLETDPVHVRGGVGVGLRGVSSDIKVGMALVTGKMIGASRRGSLGLALLAGFSLAPAVFGSVPEHHALSALVLTATFGLATTVRLAFFPDRYSV